MAQHDMGHLSAFDGASKLVNIVVETSKGMRTKVKYDEKRHVFLAEKVLPVGVVFPFDFGFLPSTMAEDGDPLWTCYREVRRTPPESENRTARA